MEIKGATGKQATHAWTQEIRDIVEVPDQGVGSSEDLEVD